eukprot:CAMPEP_0119380536 /NCGR_PEP_ID=MMETSP1334-20130426/57390_1 /TAXON_ID=127549 /ORGANISM="Calcidiscus leptoporus, Strain RCC1130" /LENGTH=124 /DNA_ID=CAMNT_0007400403 /DNA_START=483 /DNA_END=857 /DNA_ORIENTATION=+
MWYTPNLFCCSKDLTGAVPTYPSEAELLDGNFPCHTLALWTPFGVSDDPHGNRLRVPARAASSHSASVGSRPPVGCAQLQKAEASVHEICTTGWSKRPSAKTSEPGPSGWRQLAPSTRIHQGAA